MVKGEKRGGLNLGTWLKYGSLTSDLIVVKAWATAEYFGLIKLIIVYYCPMMEKINFTSDYSSSEKLEKLISTDFLKK